MSIYNLGYTANDGREINLSEYEGQVMILVNTASKCGFTPQYEGLEDLYQKYKQKGFTIIAFPCNQFNEQEPGTNEEVEEFCKLNYGVSFPLASKSDVRGRNINQVFKYLCDNTEFKGFGKGVKSLGLTTMLKSKYGKEFKDSSIKWNFTKFLIDRSGQIIGRFEPTTRPSQMEAIIEKCLSE